MENLQSSRPWRKKINGPAMMSRSDYDSVFGVPRWQSAPFSLRLDDYTDIFDTASSASSIPVLDLSVAENGFETAGERSAGAGVDYFDIFGSYGGGGFAASYEELLAEPKTSRGSPLEGRTRWDLLSEQKEKEASEHPLKVYTENNEPNMEKNRYSSLPGQSDDTSLKQFSTSSKMSDKTIDNVVSVKKNWGKLDAIPGYAVSADANDPAQESKNKAVNKGAFINTGTNCYTLDGGQKNDTAPYFPSIENIVVNPLKSDCASLLDVSVDEKHNSRSYNHNPTSSGHIPLQDVAYLKVSEINLHTKPFKGPPPSRPPPELSMKPEHPKVLGADSEFNVEERSYLESEVNDQLYSSSEATKIHTINESMKDISFLHDSEMDLSSAAAISIAAIKEAMEQAQIRLASAKKLMDRKNAKLHWKFGPPKTVSSKEDGSSYEVKLNSWGQDANNLLKESIAISESTVVEREENSTAVKIPLNHEERRIQLPSYRKDQQRLSNENASKSFVEREEISAVGKIPLDHGEIKMQIPSYIKDQQQVRKVNTSKSSQVACKIIEIAKELKKVEENYDLPRNDNMLTTLKDMKIEGDEKNAKAAIWSVEGTEKYCKDSEQAVEVEEKQRSMEGSVCIEKLEKNSKLKGPSMDCMEEVNKNFVDATMDAFLLKAHASELKEDYGFVLPDENQKQSEALEDNNNECIANKTDSVVDYCLLRENVNDLQNYNIDFKPWLANGYCEEKELEFTELVSGYEEYKSKINANHIKHELYENKEMKVPNEVLFYDVLLKEIKEPEELCTFNITDKKEVDEEVKPCRNYENGTRSVNCHYSYNANRCKIEERDKAAGKGEGDEFQENEEAHILVENELEKEAIQNDNGLENGLEMPKVQEKIKDAELETILNFGKTTTCKDCNEKETRKVRTTLQEVEESLEDFMNAAGKGEGDGFQATEEAYIFVENELEKEAIQNDNGLENGLEMPKVQEKIKDAELETILNFGKTTTCKDCNEKETREVRTALQELEESLEDFMNQNVKNSEFLASPEVPVLFENQISLKTADEAGQLGEIEESDSGKVFLSRKEASLCTEVQKNKNKMTVNRERDKDQETTLEEKELVREIERGRIAMERANYEAHQQELAEAQVRAERFAVERATAEARQRALAEAQQKAEKAAEAEKASREARLRAERVAVERATEEARKRAIKKALAEKVAADKALAEKMAADARARTAQVSASNKESRTEHFKATPIKEDSEARHKPNSKIHRNTQSQTAANSSNGRIYSDSHNNVGGGAESMLTSKARQERQQHTADPSAKALPEKNMRDMLAKQEQAKLDRWAESLDVEVKRWSNGKDGNLRALLSSLQYILGPDSGWQPVPLVDIIDVAAAKKAYRKATLCVHPDKLQQRGASVQHKHICEKVFDLLQEAWNKFNSEEQ